METQQPKPRTVPTQSKPENSPDKPNTFATLMGGTDMTVSLLDGATEAIKVRQLPVSLLPAMSAAITDERKIVALYCDKSVEWSDSLTRESFVKMIEEGDKLNADFFAQWQSRMFARLDRVRPGLAESLLKGIFPNLSSK